MDSSQTPSSEALSPQLSSDMSSPLSTLSRSPSPPMNYPSPVPSQEAPTENSTKRECDDSPSSQPPGKRRRVTDPKPRKQQYLDLSGDFPLASQIPQIDLLKKVLRRRRKIVVIAGAGISVSAGIPDFRSSTGLFSSLRAQHNLKSSGKHLFDASVYRDDSTTTSFHQMVRELSHLSKQAEPTEFHHLLARLGQEGRLLRLYSQNVDGIDTSLPPLATSIPLNNKGPWPRTVQLHGGLEKMVCSKCHQVSEFNGELFDGPEPPSCTTCEETDSVRTQMAGKRSHGIGKLRPRMVLYNEYNPDEEAIGSVTTADLRCRPDAVIVVGTSLKVPGVKRIVREMCSVVRGRRDGVAIWINTGPLPSGKDFENCWDLVVKGNSDAVAEIAKLPHWDVPEDLTVEPAVAKARLACADAEMIEADSKKHVQVIVSSTVANLQGLPTPSASPRPLSPKISNKAIAAAPPIKFSLLKGSDAVLNSKKTSSDSKPPAKKRGRPRKNPEQTKPADKVKPLDKVYSVAKKSSLSNLKAPTKITIRRPKPEREPTPEEVKVMVESQITAEHSRFKNDTSVGGSQTPVKNEEKENTVAPAIGSKEVSPKAPAINFIVNPS